MRLIYIYDPLCGWCYGFGPVMQQIEQAFPHLPIEVLSGGMVLGDRVGPIGRMSDYLLKAIPHLEQTTGVRIGAPYMEIIRKGDMVLSSEKPCIALTVFKSLSNQSAVAFAKAIQTQLFEHGNHLDDEAVYESLCVQFDLPWEVFQQKLRSEDYKKRTYEEFAYVQQMGVTGFPCLLLVQENQGYLLSRGYSPLESLKENIESVIDKLAGG
jgi:putative protein-disulfide isomerase